jgi:predicted nucleotidyltransferase
MQSITKATLRKKKSDIETIARKHGAYNIRIFGSVARDETHAGSDLDLLIDMEPDRSLLDHIALIQDLEAYLGCKVDVVTEKSLKERLKKRIITESVPL